MTNESLNGLCKLGHIHVPDKISQKRAKELSNTSIPTDYKVEFDIKVKNARKYENILHNKLKDIRFKQNKEFFKCEPDDIMKYFKLENLITCEEDKYDFPDNYFTLYNNNIRENKNINEEYNNNIKNNAESTEKNINNIMDFECKLCNHEFSNNSNLLKHYKSSIHLYKEEIHKKCCKCNKNFNNIKLYKQHKYNVHIKIKKSTDKNLNNTIIDNNN